MRLFAALSVVVVIGIAPATRPVELDVVQPNDNRTPAGTLENGVLTIAGPPRFSRSRDDLGT